MRLWFIGIMCCNYKRSLFDQKSTYVLVPLSSGQNMFGFSNALRKLEIVLPFLLNVNKSFTLENSFVQLRYRGCMACESYMTCLCQVYAPTYAQRCVNIQINKQIWINKNLNNIYWRCNNTTYWTEPGILIVLLWLAY